MFTPANEAVIIRGHDEAIFLLLKQDEIATLRCTPLAMTVPEKRGCYMLYYIFNITR
ncbi:hypothetical protein [Flavobacterium zepuense]|uniref:hypothetical protein n=1 Tax=Flavobacterium zepuense TaxID=2593302 RepID=UPI00163D56FC|nr:hypothetical protein [Flavobacterium zepuense]